MLLRVVVLVIVGGERGGRVVPWGHVFSPSPCPAPVSSLTQDQTSSLPPLLLPSCLLAPQLEVHLLCLISLLAMGYVYHQCTIFAAEVCMPHLGIGYQVQMGSLLEKGNRGLWLRLPLRQNARIQLFT